MRFSLRTLLVGVTLAAIYCGVLFGLPASIANVVLAVLSVVLPSFIVGGIVYSREAWRAFWIGCAAGGLPLGLYLNLGVVLPMYSGLDDSNDWYRYLMATWHGAIVVNGIIVVAVRWICTRSRPLDGARYVFDADAPEEDGSYTDFVSR